MVFRNDYGTWGVPRFEGTNLGLAFSDDGQVKLYYGAADTVICLATARLDDLLALCEPS